MGISRFIMFFRVVTDDETISKQQLAQEPILQSFLRMASESTFQNIEDREIIFIMIRTSLNDSLQAKDVNVILSVNSDMN